MQPSPRPYAAARRSPRPRHLAPRTGRPRRGTRQRTRGQALVEFSLALPIILFLTLISLDFGRVYLGWINLQNMARVAANFAANNPTAAWANPADPTVLQYQNLVRADASANNCNLPLVGGVQTAPTPTFVDANGDGMRGIGDTAEVDLTCQFTVITPVISRVVGSPLSVSASSLFPVKAGMTATGPGGGGGGTIPNSAFTGNSTQAPSSMTGIAPFTVVFRDTSGGNPTGWLWTFPDDGTSTSAQDPLDHVFQNPGTYVVSMTASNATGSGPTQTMGVTVVASGTVDFTSDTQGGNAPQTVSFTSTAAGGGTSYDWTFGAGQGTGSGATTSHTYSTAGTYNVTLTVTYANGPLSITKANYITIAPKLCTVPTFDGVKRNSANSLWTSAGFTGTLATGPGQPLGNGNWTIKSQTITATSIVPCTASIQVNDH